MEKLGHITPKQMTSMATMGKGQSHALPPPLRIAQTTCHVCKGVGWLRVDCAVGDPRFGKPVKCACQMSEAGRREIAGKILRTYRWLNQGEDFALEMEHMTFEMFRPQYHAKKT